MGPSENAILQVGPNEVRLFQMGLAEDGPFQMCAAELCPSQVGPPQVQPRVLATEVDSIASSEDGEGSLNVRRELSGGLLLIRGTALLPRSALLDIGGQDLHHRPVIRLGRSGNPLEGIDPAQTDSEILTRDLLDGPGKAVGKLTFS